MTIVGIAGAAIAVLVVVADMFTVVEYVVRREAARIAITEQQQAVVVGDTLNMLVFFPLFAAGGFYFRRKPETHKRRFFTLFSIAGLRAFAAVLRARIPSWLCHSWGTISPRGGAPLGQYLRRRVGGVEPSAAQSLVGFQSCGRRIRRDLG